MEDFKYVMAILPIPLFMLWMFIDLFRSDVRQYGLKSALKKVSLPIAVMVWMVLWMTI